MRVGMREVANRLDEVTLVLAGDEVRCKEDLAGSVDVLIRDNRGEFLGWTHWLVSQARSDCAGT